MTPPRPTALTEEEQTQLRQIRWLLRQVNQGDSEVRDLDAIIRRLDAETTRLRDGLRLLLTNSSVSEHQRLIIQAYLGSDDIHESMMLALIRERDALRAVARAAECWRVRKGHGTEGHSCDLCDALAALDRAVPGWRDG